MNVGVKTKLFGLILGTAMLALLAACVTFVLYDRTSYADAKKATLTVLADAVADSAYGPAAFEDEESSKYVLHTVGAERTALTAAIYLSGGKRLAFWEREGTKFHLPPELPKASFAAPKKILLLRVPIEKDGTKVGEFNIAFSTDDIDARTQQFIRIAGLVLLGAIFLATLVVLASHRVFTVPVQRLGAAAKQVRDENRFDIRVDKTSNDELGVLTDAFNSMLSAVQARDAELLAHREHLEHLVEERTADLDRRNQAMRLVLNTVDQGLTTLELDGRLESERSAIFDRWFSVAPGETFGSVVEKRVGGFVDRFEISFDQIREGLLPLDVALDQLPRRMVSDDGLTFSLDYRPILSGETVTRVLVIVTDITDHVARERADREQRQVISMFEQIARDRAGFVEFLADADGLAKKLTDASSRERGEVLRDLHTLKGNCGIFELYAVADCCHEIEEGCFESEGVPSADDRHRLALVWGNVTERARLLLGEVSNSLVVDLVDYDELLTAVRAKYPGTKLSHLVERLGYEPVAPRLERMGGQTKRLASRLGVEGLDVQVKAERLRLPGSWGWLWSLLPHLLRNAVDHGLVGRPLGAPAILRLGAEEKGGELIIEVVDNGKGVDWVRLAEVAKRKGLPSTTKDELARALFADEVSTREVASEVSGRGVGMAAVYAEVKNRGGRIEVASAAGAGTSFKIILPLGDNPVVSDKQSIRARSLLPASFGVQNIVMKTSA